jgi:hypothetical protein
LKLESTLLTFQLQPGILFDSGKLYALFIGVVRKSD